MDLSPNVQYAKIRRLMERGRICFHLVPHAVMLVLALIAALVEVAVELRASGELFAGDVLDHFMRQRKCNRPAVIKALGFDNRPLSNLVDRPTMPWCTH